MAKYTGPLTLTGTIGSLTFYRMHEQTYVRQKSSLTGKRVKKDPAFKSLMANSGLMGQASRIAAVIYKQLPDTIRKHPLFRKITGEAYQLLRAGETAQAITHELTLQYLAPPILHTPQQASAPRCASMPYTPALPPFSYPAAWCKKERISKRRLRYQAYIHKYRQRE